MAKRKLLKGYEEMVETFTSLKARTIVPLSFLRYQRGLDKERTLMTESKTISIQRGVEFDVAKELGFYQDSEEKQDFNFTLRELVTDGYLVGGETKKLNPKEVYAKLVKNVSSPNGVIYWKNRPLKPEVAELIKKNEDLEANLEKSEAKIEELRKLLEKNKISV